MIGKPKRILIYHLGTLGDTLATVPAVRAIADQFPQAQRSLLFHEHVHEQYVLPVDVMSGADLYDDFVAYRHRQRASNRWQWQSAFDLMRLACTLRRKRFDTLVYLKPSLRGSAQCARDRAFFRLAGIRRFIGMSGFYQFPPRLAGETVAHVPHETDLLLARLAASGTPVPPPGEARVDLSLRPEEYRAAADWVANQRDDGGRTWIGFGPGCKQAVNLWPEERYAELGRRLVEQFDCWPVIFGSSADRPKAQRLIAAWGRGACAAGDLSIRSSIAALERCTLFIGNDTGTIHMAAAAGVRCVGVYSGKNFRGLWDPYGKGHQVLKPAQECAHCLAGTCVEAGRICVRSNTVNNVFDACCSSLSTSPFPGVRRAREHSGVRE